MHERLLRLIQSGTGVCVLLLAHGVAAQDLGPFRAPNLSPPVAVFGLPIWSGVPVTTTYGATFELANHYRFSRDGADVLTLDGETLRVRTFVEWPFRDRWSFGADVPLIVQSGGVLDNIVDAWHSAFRLPDGARNARPEDVIEFRLADAAGIFFERESAGGGLGDIRLSLARALGARRNWSLRATVKLPTGDESLLAGSGKTDMNLSALHQRDYQLRGRASRVFFGAALIDLRQPENIRFQAKEFAVAAVAGGGVALGARFGIKGQLDVYSALYESGLREIGRTGAQATLGGWYRMKRAMQLDFAIGEDIEVSTSPDVVIFLGLSRRWP